MSLANNPFAALSAYGSSEEENYLTESLAFMVRIFLERDPEAGLAALDVLKGPLAHQFIPSKVHVETQQSLGVGWIDLQLLQDREAIVLVEIKAGAPLGQGQLEYYFEEMKKLEVKHRQLTLLTRSKYSAIETNLSEGQYHHVCWYELYEFFSDVECQDDVLEYLKSEFCNFLEDKAMSLEKVSWEYSAGVLALINLTDMMEVAAAEVAPTLSMKRTAGWTWRGLTLGSTYFFGVRYSEHHLLVLENNQGTAPTFRRVLDLEKERFLALSKDEQFELTGKFLRRALQETDHEIPAS